ncbi:hypothetical protein SAMN04487895_10389 [Paenibacillus sophorae]|uniref:Uncharacterized protein n=1 Tax=Paenibacillus sophorae TaxID=1333845 RepID=A0A1H8JPA4_9BACL|nr:hypothetical protein [Paenibacillus sophorae]QWU13425.1 hypothetical protein KP014_15605 [Paenibacillus sophorae]SEN82156.1 hypothetical protein SAMN04487895_10389 [Paenibacillus sophorae]
MHDPYTSVAVSIDNVDGAVTELFKKLKFDLVPPIHCELHLFNDAVSHEWRYMLLNNSRNCLSKGSLTNEQFEFIFNEIQIYADIVTKDEREYEHIINALTDVLQDDYTTIIKGESSISELVQKGLIRARTADGVIAALNSRGVY